MERRPVRHSASDTQNSPSGGDGSDAGAVLLADDDEDLRETMGLWLRSEGWDVREAGDGESALRKIDDTVDVLVLDRRMPRLSGPEVVERLDGEPFTGTTVVLSAFEPDAGLDSGDVAEYLVKPIDKPELVGTLERVSG